MDTDRNLLFGVLALQADLLTPVQFAEACSAWAGRKDVPLADLLVQRGLLNAEQRGVVELLLRAKLHKHGGDVRASLAEVTNDHVRRSLAGLADGEIQQSLAPPTPPPQGHVLLATTEYVPGARDRYTLSRLHATGGIGRVWLARDGSLGRDVALKELRPERAGQPAVWGRFLREAQVTGQLEHPGIVPVYEVGRRPDDQAPFYTMRFVRGRTLAEAAAAYHRRRAAGEAGPLELRELLAAFVGVCNAVAYAHSRGVLHRDLKPQNVVLGDYGEVIVLDWGLAKVTGEADGDAGPLDSASEEAGATMQGQVLGTPAYMAPEQAEGRLDALSPATDVYGLGAILYEVLTGRAPFPGADTTAVLRRVVHEPPPRPGTVIAGLPRALEAVCLKALAKAPGGRYATAKEVAAEVQRWLADEPVTAYREPLVVRAGRWARRHRPLVAGAAAALVATLVGLGAVLAVQAQANADLQEANAKVSQANEDLQAANEREQQRFALALGAIKLFHGNVSEDVLLKEKQFDGLRTKLLRGAADFYRKLEAQLKDQDDPKSRAALAGAYDELADLVVKIGSSTDALGLRRQALAVRRELAARPGAGEQERIAVAWGLVRVGWTVEDTGDPAGALAAYREAAGLAAELDSDAAREKLAEIRRFIGDALLGLGRSADSLAEYTKAVAAFQARADAHPTDMECQRNLAVSLNNYGNCLEQARKGPEAVAAHERALIYYQRVADHEPGNPERQYAVAISHRNRGSALWRAGKPPETVLAALEQAAVILRKLTKTHAAVTRYQHELALVYGSTGFECERAGKPAEAMAAYEQAQPVLLRLTGAHPDVPRYRLDLGMNFQNTGSQLERLSRWADALAAYERSRDIFQRLADEYPDVIEHQDQLARSLSNVGIARHHLGKNAAAVESFEKETALRRKLADAHPADAQRQRVLAFSLARNARLHHALGHPGEAAAAFRGAAVALGRIDPPTADLLREQASYRALAASVARRLGAGSTAEAAAEANRAVDALRKAVVGYPEFTRLTRNANLAVLRSRDDFQKLIAELKAEAIRRRQELLRREPYNASAHQVLGNVCMNAGFLDDAEAAYREAIQLGGGKDVRAIEALAHLLLSRSDFDGAVAGYRDVIRLRPQDARAHAGLGRALQGKGDLDGAIAAYQEALRLDARQRESLVHLPLTRQMREVLPRLPDVLAGRAEPKTPAEAVSLARLCGQPFHGRYAFAVSLFDKALAADATLAELPLKPRTHRYEAAVCAVRAARGDGVDAPVSAADRVALRGKALAWLRADLMLRRKQLTSLDPRERDAADAALRLWYNDPDMAAVWPGGPQSGVSAAEASAWNDLWVDAAVTHEARILRPLVGPGRPPALAAASWEDPQEVVRREPNNPSAHYFLARAHRAAGALDAAEAAYREAVRLDGRHYGAAIEALGDLLLFRRNFDGAIAVYRDAVRLRPDYPPAHVNLSRALQAKGAVDGAVAALQEAVRLDPKDAIYRMYLGDQLTQLRDSAGAIRAYREAVRLAPKLPAAHERLAWVLAAGPDCVRDGRHAAEHATRACELTGWKGGRFLSTLAAACAEAGDFGKAVAFQQKALAFPVCEIVEGPILRERLERYARKQPYHDPALAATKSASPVKRP